MSLLSQMRPAPSENYNRKWEPRRYLPDYNLARYITLPPLSGGTPDPMQDVMPTATPINPDCIRRTYKTRYGELHPPAIDQFSRHWQWKSASQNAYVLHNPPFPSPEEPPVKPDYHPGQIDMVRQNQMGKNDPKGPYEYQKLLAVDNRGRRPYLPENKAWESITSDYRPFPHNTFPVTKFFREVKHPIAGRSKEEVQTVYNQIREIAKKPDGFNPQYVKPYPRWHGHQTEVRPYEAVERTPGRNPPYMQTESQATYKRFPAEEYQIPEHGMKGEVSRAMHFVKETMPEDLGWLPASVNISPYPNDLRLVSGYRIGLPVP